MKVLLSDGSGATARQVAAQAGAAGHAVDVVSPSRLALCAFTRHVGRVHRVPAYGCDPHAWLEATLRALEAGRHDVLLATHEQVALLAREAARVRALDVGLAVPSFESVLAVQDKIAQRQTLARLELTHPATWIARSRVELLEQTVPPVYVKAAIGTASAAVWHVRSRRELIRAVDELAAYEGVGNGGVVVQEPVTGPLAMAQAVFARGVPVAWHCNMRLREGASGGASVKESAHLPVVAEHLARLGSGLSWHGALSLDAILTPDGPCYIDINPRLVEPANAWRAGVDLVDALLRLSCEDPGPPVQPGRPGIRTHQLLIAVLGAAQKEGTRRAILREVLEAAARRGAYGDSVEELTPVDRDPLTAVPLLAAIALTLALPTAWRWFSASAVDAHALTPQAWRAITDAA
jgi:biotin carboxylase